MITIIDYRTGARLGSASTLQRAEIKAQNLAESTDRGLWIADADGLFIEHVKPNGSAERVNIIRDGRAQRSRLEYQGARI